MPQGRWWSQSSHLETLSFENALAALLWEKVLQLEKALQLAMPALMAAGYHLGLADCAVQVRGTGLVAVDDSAPGNKTVLECLVIASVTAAEIVNCQPADLSPSAQIQ